MMACGMRFLDLNATGSKWKGCNNEVSGPLYGLSEVPKKWSKPRSERAEDRWKQILLDA